jgi:hypothetical protein
MRVHTLQIAGFLFVTLLIGCGDASQSPQETIVPTEIEYISGECPVTLPGETVKFAGANFNHGKDGVWTTLWPQGTVTFRPDGPGHVNSNGSMSMKFPWWSLIEDSLTIEGRRLDSPGKMASHTEGRLSTGFVPSGITFPSEGCWEVTGSVGDASLTFVTLAVKV